MALEGTGDEVLFYDDERADAPDLLDIGKLRAAQELRAFGAMLGAPFPVGATGGAGGALTWGGIDTSAVTAALTQCTVNAFLYEEFLDGSDASTFQARIVRTRATGINVGAFRPALSLPWLWVVRQTSDQDVDARRKWDVGGATEIGFSPKTRRRQVTVFTLALTRPAAMNGVAWTAVAHLGAWSGAAGAEVPTFYAKPAWDVTDLTKTPDGTESVESSAVLLNDGQATLAYLLLKMRTQIAALKDSTGATNWLTGAGTGTGVKQLKVTADAARGRVFAAGRIGWTGVAFEIPFNETDGVASVATEADACTITVQSPTVQGLVGTWTIIAVTATGLLGTNAYHCVAEIITSNPTAAGPHIRVRPMGPGHTAERQSFFLTIIAKKV